jgi:hypothetical protein
MTKFAVEVTGYWGGLEPPTAEDMRAALEYWGMDVTLIEVTPPKG